MQFLSAFCWHCSSRCPAGIGKETHPEKSNHQKVAIYEYNHWIWEWIYREESWRRGPFPKAVSFDSEFCGIAGLAVDLTVGSVVDRGRVQVSIASLSRAREAPLVPWLQFTRKSEQRYHFNFLSWRIHTRWAAIIFSASYTEKPHRGHPLPSTGLDSFPGIKSTLKMWRQFWCYECLINLNLAVNLELTRFSLRRIVPARLTLEPERTQFLRSRSLWGHSFWRSTVCRKSRRLGSRSMRLSPGAACTRDKWNRLCGRRCSRIEGVVTSIFWSERVKVLMPFSSWTEEHQNLHTL